MSRLEFSQDLRQYTFIILDSLSFIKDKQFKLIPLQLTLLLHYSFECCDHHIKLMLSHFNFENFSFFSSAIET